MILLLIAATLLLAYANGANDNFKATATAYGAGVLGYERGRRLATVAQLAGSLASVALASALIGAFSGKGLVPDAVVGDPRFLVAVGSGAAVTVLIATRVGLPISTTHALVGGLVGAGLVLSPLEFAGAALVRSYFVPLLVSPLLATAVAATLYPIANRSRRALGISSDTCVCIGEDRLPVDVFDNGGLVLRRTGARLSVAEMAECRAVYQGGVLGFSVQGLVDRLHLASAFSLGFARGLNDTPKVLALLVAAGWSGLDGRLSLMVVAGAMALGGWLGARRVAETLSNGITTLSHGQGLLANAIASALVIGASLLGSPVSTTHVSTGAIFGIGAWNDRTEWRMVGGILAAWLVTLPAAAITAAIVAASLG